MCFPDEIGKHFHMEIRAFSGDVHLARWGTVAFAIPQVLALRSILCHGWNLRTYQGGDPQQHTANDLLEESDDDGSSNISNAQLVDTAILDVKWWSMLSVAEKLCLVIRRLFHLAEWCPCHDRLVLIVESMMDTALKHEPLRLWATCPLRGCQGPALAGQEFLEELDTLCDQFGTELFFSFGEDLVVTDKAQMVHEFGCGRGAMVVYFTVKWSHWPQEPWSMFLLAHPSQEVGRAALGRILASTEEHPLILDLRSADLYEEALLWQGGVCMTDPRCGVLAGFTAQFAFSWTAERRLASSKKTALPIFGGRERCEPAPHRLGL